MAKRLGRKKAKNFYAAFPARISETPEMNNLFQYLFPHWENGVYISHFRGIWALVDGHSTAFIQEL